MFLYLNNRLNKLIFKDLDVLYKNLLNSFGDFIINRSGELINNVINFNKNDLDFINKNLLDYFIKNYYLYIFKILNNMYFKNKNISENDINYLIKIFQSENVCLKDISNFEACNLILIKIENRIDSFLKLPYFSEYELFSEKFNKILTTIKENKSNIILKNKDISIDELINSLEFMQLFLINKNKGINLRNNITHFLINNNIDYIYFDILKYIYNLLEKVDYYLFTKFYDINSCVNYFLMWAIENNILYKNTMENKQLEEYQEIIYLNKNFKYLKKLLDIILNYNKNKNYIKKNNNILKKDKLFINNLLNDYISGKFIGPSYIIVSIVLLELKIIKRDVYLLNILKEYENITKLDKKGNKIFKYKNLCNSSKIENSIKLEAYIHNRHIYWISMIMLRYLKTYNLKNNQINIVKIFYNIVINKNYSKKISNYEKLLAFYSTIGMSDLNDSDIIEIFIDNKINDFISEKVEYLYLLESLENFEFQDIIDILNGNKNYINNIKEENMILSFLNILKFVDEDILENIIYNKLFLNVKKEIINKNLNIDINDYLNVKYTSILNNIKKENQEKNEEIKIFENINSLEDDKKLILKVITNPFNEKIKEDVLKEFNKKAISYLYHPKKDIKLKELDKIIINSNIGYLYDFLYNNFAENNLIIKDKCLSIDMTKKINIPEDMPYKFLFNVLDIRNKTVHGNYNIFLNYNKLYRGIILYYFKIIDYLIIENKLK